jgi:flagellar biosynthesis GTPase FlhF
MDRWYYRITSFPKLLRIYAILSNRKMPPLIPVSSLDTRPTELARPSVRQTIPFVPIKERVVEARNVCAVYAQASMKEKKWRELEAEKQKDEEELAAEKAKKKKAANEKRAQQARRDAADKKVDRMLKVKGFEAQLKAKGEANKKKQKGFLKKIFLLTPRIVSNYWQSRKIEWLPRLNGTRPTSRIKFCG